MMQLCQHELMWKTLHTISPPPQKKKKETPKTHIKEMGQGGSPTARERQDLRQIHKILEEVQTTLCHQKEKFTMMPT